MVSRLVKNVKPMMALPIEDVSADEVGQVDNDKPIEHEPQPIKRSSWVLVEQEAFTQDVEEYITDPGIKC